MANNQANFDNIRRKAPTSRKSQIQVLEESVTSQQQHIAVLNENIRSMTQQIDQLQASCSDLGQKNKLLVNEILVMQRMMEVQKRAQADMLGYLEHKDASPCHPNQKNDSFDPDGRLRRARGLLSSGVSGQVAEISQALYTPSTHAQTSVYPDQLGTALSVMPEGSDMPTLYGAYPTGRKVGIDPFHADHIDKIPYIRAPDAATSPDAAATQSTSLGSENTNDWGPRKPCILLVEDDKVCRRIGTKFLQNLGCNVRTAVSRLEGFLSLWCDKLGTDLPLSTCITG
jgi:osomolarity two-component system response regulator SKN7